MKPEEIIKKLHNHFRILRDWEIKYIRGEDHYNSVTKNPRKRKAYIYQYRGRPPKDYFFHEILHICMSEIAEAPCDRKYDGMIDKFRREKEEIFIQDLCLLIKTLERSDQK